MTKIQIIGIGGSGCNTLSRIKRYKIKGVELVAINTDVQDLLKTKSDLKIQIGMKITQGWGTGMNPEIGRKAALENKEEIEKAMKGTDMVFIVGGEGGGTFTGAAPVVAEIAKRLGILTLAVATTPFSFEGGFRRKIAEQGIVDLRQKVDSLICISNDKLFLNLDPKISLPDAFLACDDILRQAVQGISDLITLPGIINVDFADVKTILRNSRSAHFGIGLARGEKRAETAAGLAIKSPLLDISPKGAKGVLFNVSGGSDISLSEIETVAKVITQEVGPDTKVMFGAVQSESLKKGEIKVTVIAAGF